MQKISTTINPNEELEVSDEEALYLTDLGLVHNSKHSKKKETD